MASILSMELLNGQACLVQHEPRSWRYLDNQQIYVSLQASPLMYSKRWSRVGEFLLLLPCYLLLLVQLPKAHLSHPVVLLLPPR